MASISSVGPSSGLDVNSIVTATQGTASRPPFDHQLSEADAHQAQLSSLGKLHSTLSTFLDAADKLSQPHAWAGTHATSSDPATVTALSHNAAAANYSVAVHSLASAQTSSTGTYPDADSSTGVGTLHIEIGAWSASQATFTNNPNWPKSSIVVGPHDNSLERIRDKINAAGMGVVATVISDATGSRLVLRSTSTGADNGFKVSTDADQPDTQTPDANQAGMRIDTQAATDATGTVNGVAIQSSTNTIDKAVDGLTFQFNKVSDSPVHIAVASDTEHIKKAIHDFARSYNTLNAMGQPAETSTALQPSPLSKSLAEIGLSFGANGAMNIDDTRLASALSEPPAGIGALSSLAQHFGQLVNQLARDAQPSPPGADMGGYTTRQLSQYRTLENSG
ncbi:MAG: flagellar filament capping protein FliD [Burkholderiales bacterium]|nr:flagellar filament capping protein FliD [Burkholderiales bacterium]